SLSVAYSNIPWPICRMFAAHDTWLATRRALARLGSRIATSSAMMAITTSNSIKVNAPREELRLILYERIISMSLLRCVHPFLWWQGLRAVRIVHQDFVSAFRTQGLAFKPHSRPNEHPRRLLLGFSVLRPVARLRPPSRVLTREG